jgi:hypothetical protein
MMQQKARSRYATPDCRCFATDSLPRGYPGQLFGLRRKLNLTVNARDSRFMLVRALVIE